MNISRQRVKTGLIIFNQMVILSNSIVTEDKKNNYCKVLTEAQFVSLEVHVVDKHYNHFSASVLVSITNSCFYWKNIKISPKNGINTLELGRKCFVEY